MDALKKRNFLGKDAANRYAVKNNAEDTAELK